METGAIKMKERYEEIEFDVLNFESEDIVFTSTTKGNNETVDEKIGPSKP